MSGLVKAVFKPIKKIWKGVKKVASKVWDKIKKPVMVAAGLYLTAGLGASFMTGSLASGFGSVNSAIGGFFGVSEGTAGVAETMAASEGGATLAGAGQGASAATELGALSSAGSSSFTTAGGTTLTGSTGVQMGSAAANAAGGTVGSTVVADQAGKSLLADTASKVGQVDALGTEKLAQQMGQKATEQAAQPGFFESVKNTASNVMDGNWAKAGGNAWDAVSSGASNVWDAATGTTGAALLTSNLLQGYSQYEQAKDMEDRWKRRSYWGMDGYGNTASTQEQQAPQPRGAIAPTTIDDLIRQSRGG